MYIFNFRTYSFYKLEIPTHIFKFTFILLVGMFILVLYVICHEVLIHLLPTYFFNLRTLSQVYMNFSYDMNVLWKVNHDTTSISSPLFLAIFEKSIVLVTFYICIFPSNISFNSSEKMYSSRLQRTGKYSHLFTLVSLRFILKFESTWNWIL